MHFVMYEFSNQVKVVRNVTPIDLLVQSAVLFVQRLNFRADMQIRPYRFHKLYGAGGYVCAMAVLFQQPTCPPETRCVCTDNPFYPFRLW